MPRYFFRVAEDGLACPHPVDLPDLASVRREAVRTACSLIEEASETFWANGGEWEMTVTDERGLTMFSLIFLATSAPATLDR
jgi:hypothetical protein